MESFRILFGTVDDGLPLFWPECVSREFGEGEQFSA
jgi:hypothetical protein